VRAEGAVYDCGSGSGNVVMADAQMECVLAVGFDKRSICKTNERLIFDSRCVIGHEEVRWKPYDNVGQC
jgi:hypothetical protein